jgi:hypothetical protein
MGFCEHNKTTCYTPRDSMARVHEAFTEERTVSKGLWPARSPDLSKCDFCLWGYLKGKAYESNPHTLDELRKNMLNAIQTIEVGVLRKMYLNRTTRAQKCVGPQGFHFQHLL